MGNAYVHEHEGRLVLFCCRDCVHKFNKESEKYLKKLNKAIVVKQRPDYPMKACVVTGRMLGKDAVDYVSGNRLVRLCSGECVSKFDQDRKTYLMALAAAKSVKNESEGRADTTISGENETEKTIEQSSHQEGNLKEVKKAEGLHLKCQPCEKEKGVARK